MEVGVVAIVLLAERSLHFKKNPQDTETIAGATNSEYLFPKVFIYRGAKYALEGPWRLMDES